MLDISIQSEAMGALRDAGLLVDNVEFDAGLRRVPTLDKPRSKNGAYIAHSDAPTSIWWHNWATGESSTWTAKEQNKLTASEKATLARRIDDARKAREAEQAAAIAETAKRAQGIYTIAAECIEHPYMTSKGVAACHGLRLYNGALVVPAYDDSYKVATLQFIPGEPDDNGKWPKKYLKGQKAKGCFFPIGGKKKDKPLVICEGLATGLSLYECIGLPVLMAFDAENLLPVAVMARDKYPEREIILAADNDTETDGNPGVTKATAAARAIGGSLAVPRLDGQAVDFNDLHKKMGVGEVKTQFMMHRTPAAEESAKEVTGIDGDVRPDDFFVKLSDPRPGLYHVETKKDGRPVETWIGAPLQVLGKTCDEHGSSWGLLLEWHDPKGLRHTWAMRKKMLVGKDSAEYFGRLIDEGWESGPGTYVRKLLTDYLLTYQTNNYMKCVNRTGWHGGAFVFPDEVVQKNGSTNFLVGQVGQVGQAYGEKDFNMSHLKNGSGTGGTTAEQIVLQVDTPRNPFQKSGTLDGWKSTIGAWANGNSRISMALCASFAAPLIELVGQESGGFNWTGPSSIGKTTVLIAAGSIWGKGTSSDGYIQSWRATDNGLEGLAALHSDTAFCLDEIGQAPGRTIMEAAYMLANGMGKARAHQSGNARTPKSWRCMVLSTGEVGLAEKIASEGGRVRAGQLVRLIDVPADAGRGLGIFDNLHGHASARIFAGAIKQAAATHYGHAARAFIARIVQSDSDSIRAKIACQVDDATKLLCPAGASGQVQRAAQRFAVCAVAGELAVEWGLLPWEPGDAANAVKACLDAWLASRGGAGPAEDAAILEQVTLFIEQHGASRFQDVDKPDALCINRAGFRRNTEAGTEFYILPESFKAEVCKGVDHKRAATLLLGKGILLPGDGKHIPRRPPCDLPGFGRKRCITLLIGGS